MSEANTERQKVENEMLNEAIKFWFNDHDHIRSPFPEYIKNDLKEQALDNFFDWTNKIAEKARKEINDEIVAEKFEEILFESASKLVKTYDLYPFLPRVGDTITDKKQPDDTVISKVADRIHVKRGDYSYMKIICKNESTGEEWVTEFELPE
jgi:hypothetical protein